VVQVAERFASLTGSTARLGQWHRDQGVQAVVQAFAAGFGVDEICVLLPAVVTSDWWRSGKHGLSSLTLEVLRRAESSHDQPKPVDTEAKRERDRRREEREIAERDKRLAPFRVGVGS
jgi:hypothetical protein